MGIDHIGRSHIPHKDSEYGVHRNPGAVVGTL